MVRRKCRGRWATDDEAFRISHREWAQYDVPTRHGAHELSSELVNNFAKRSLPTIHDWQRMSTPAHGNCTCWVWIRHREFRFRTRMRQKWPSWHAPRPRNQASAPLSTGSHLYAVVAKAINSSYPRHSNKKHVLAIRTDLQINSGRNMGMCHTLLQICAALFRRVLIHVSTVICTSCFGRTQDVPKTARRLWILERSMTRTSPEGVVRMDPWTLNDKYEPWRSVWACVYVFVGVCGRVWTCVWACVDMCVHVSACVGVCGCAGVPGVRSVGEGGGVERGVGVEGRGGGGVGFARLVLRALSISHERAPASFSSSCRASTRRKVHTSPAFFEPTHAQGLFEGRLLGRSSSVVAAKARRDSASNASLSCRQAGVRRHGRSYFAVVMFLIMARCRCPPRLSNNSVFDRHRMRMPLRFDVVRNP